MSSAAYSHVSRLYLFLFPPSAPCQVSRINSESTYPVHVASRHNGKCVHTFCKGPTCELILECGTAYGLCTSLSQPPRFLGSEQVVRKRSFSCLDFLHNICKNKKTPRSCYTVQKSRSRPHTLLLASIPQVQMHTPLLSSLTPEKLNRTPRSPRSLVSGGSAQQERKTPAAARFPRASQKSSARLGAQNAPVFC